MARLQAMIILSIRGGVLTTTSLSRQPPSDGVGEARHPVASNSVPRPAPVLEAACIDADVALLAEAIASCWQAMDGALRPIIGADGVLALYSRGITLAAADHPWLADARGSGGALPAPAALKAALVNQGGPSAAAGGRALLHTLRDLLVSLIGASLTKKLLGPTWANTLDSFPVQDTPP